MKKTLTFLGAMVVGFLLMGCAPTQQPTTIKFNMIEANHQAAKKLLDDANLSLGTSVMMTTVVNIDEIEKSSTLGRQISEHVASYCVQRGMSVTEMKIRDNIYIKQNEGELMLTREISKLAKVHSATAIIIGTYAISDSAIYVTLKMVDPNTNIVMAASDYALPLNHDTTEMLGKKSRLF